MSSTDTSTEAVHSVEEYIVHYQHVKMSRYFLFWKEIMMFHRIISEEYVIGKAYLLYQKFIKDDALLHIDCISETLKANIERKLNAAVEATEKRASENKQRQSQAIAVNFFDDALREAEAVMAEKLFTPYFQSEFYHKYKKGVQIYEGLQVVQL